MKYEPNALNVYLRRLEKDDDLFYLEWPVSPVFVKQIELFIDIARKFGECNRLSVAKCILNRLRPFCIENSGYDLCMSFIDVNNYIDQKLIQSANPERG